MGYVTDFYRQNVGLIPTSQILAEDDRLPLLPPAVRRAINATVVYDGMSKQQMASILGIQYSTFNSQLAKAYHYYGRRLQEPQWIPRNTYRTLQLERIGKRGRSKHLIAADKLNALIRKKEKLESELRVIENTIQDTAEIVREKYLTHPLLGLID